MAPRSLSSLDLSTELWFILLILKISRLNLSQSKKAKGEFIIFLPRKGFPPWFWLWYHHSLNNKIMDSPLVLFYIVCPISGSNSIPSPGSIPLLTNRSCLSVGERLTREGEAGGNKGFLLSAASPILPSEALTDPLIRIWRGKCIKLTKFN